LALAPELPRSTRVTLAPGLVGAQIKTEHAPTKKRKKINQRQGTQLLCLIFISKQTKKQTSMYPYSYDSFLITHSSKP